MPKESRASNQTQTVASGPKTLVGDEIQPRRIQYRKSGWNSYPGNLLNE